MEQNHPKNPLNSTYLPHSTDVKILIREVILQNLNFQALEATDLADF